MSDLIKTSQEVTLIKGERPQLITYKPEQIVFSLNRLENIRIQKGELHLVAVVVRYLLQANMLVNPKMQMEVKAVPRIAKAIIDGPGWKLTAEELSNIFINGINGVYGKMYYFDYPTIAGWILKYLEKDRDAILGNKKQLQQERRRNELDEMGENHRRLFKEIVGDTSKSEAGYQEWKAKYLAEKAKHENIN